jgi:hypothetical protein
LVGRTADVELVDTEHFPYLNNLISLIEKIAKDKSLTEAQKKELERLTTALDWKENNAAERRFIARLQRLREGLGTLSIQPGEAWSDQALADLTAMKAKQRAAWTALILHCQEAAGSQPSAKWLAAVKLLLDEVGTTDFKKYVQAWFALVDKPRTQVIERWSRYHPNPNLLIIEPHAEILKGLAWCCGQFEDRDLARALTALALSAYRKVPGIGPRAVKIGNACITALGMMPGLDPVGQLALIKARVKFRPAQKGIDKAFTVAAEQAGVPREDLEEMSVPTYGLTEVGRLEESLGDFTAQLKVAGNGSSQLLWMKSDGKLQKSVPAAVVKHHAEELKDLKGAAKDLQKMLPAQRERLDSLYRFQKSWPLATWRERYLDHPLVGIFARRSSGFFLRLRKRTPASGTMASSLVQTTSRWTWETKLRLPSGTRSGGRSMKCSPGVIGSTGIRCASPSSKHIARSMS